MSPQESPVVAPLPFRGLRLAALGLQTVFATLFLLLGLAAAPTPLRDPLQQLLVGWSQWGFHAPSSSYVFCLAVGLILAATGIFWVLWRLQARSWPRIALGYAVVGGVLLYLAHDDPAIRHPIKMEDISPAFPGAEESFGVLMRYGRAHPLGRDFKAPVFKDPFPHFAPDPASEWRETLKSRRTELEAHWVELAPLRTWLIELNSFDRIGDLTPARMDAEVLAFQSIRTISQHTIAIASLQAIDGHGDDAIDTVVPIIQIGRKLQPYSRTLVRSMIGGVIEHIGMSTASFILNTTAVSPAAKSRLAAALQGVNTEAGARHFISIEYAFTLGAFQGKRIGDILVESGSGNDSPWRRRAFNAISPFVYNPRATFNIRGDLYADLQDLVGRRQIDQMRTRMNRFVERDVRPGIKNSFGKLLNKMAVPPYEKVSENYWRNQDERAALLVRLGKP